MVLKTKPPKTELRKPIPLPTNIKKHFSLKNKNHLLAFNAFNICA